MCGRIRDTNLCAPFLSMASCRSPPRSDRDEVKTWSREQSERGAHLGRILAANGTLKSVCTFFFTLSLFFFLNYIYIYGAQARVCAVPSNWATGFNHSINCTAHISPPGKGKRTGHYSISAFYWGPLWCPAVRQSVC